MGDAMSPHEYYMHCILSTTAEECLKRGIDISEIMNSQASLEEKHSDLHRLLGIISNPCNEERRP